MDTSPNTIERAAVSQSEIASCGILRYRTHARRIRAEENAMARMMATLDDASIEAVLRLLSGDGSVSEELILDLRERWRAYPGILSEEVAASTQDRVLTRNFCGDQPRPW